MPADGVTYEECRKAFIHEYDSGMRHACSNDDAIALNAKRMEILSDYVEKRYNLRLTIVPTASYKDLIRIRNEEYFPTVIENIRTAIRTGINPVANGRKITLKKPNLTKGSVDKIICFAKNGKYMSDDTIKVSIKRDDRDMIARLRTRSLRGASKKDEIEIKNFFAKHFSKEFPEWTTDLKEIRKINDSFV